MTMLNIIVAVSNIACGLIAIALSVPLIRGQVRRNALYGVRFKKSFESDELWYEINRYGGHKMIRWSVVLLVLGLVSLATPFAVTLLLGFAPILLIVPALQSYRYARSL